MKYLIIFSLLFSTTLLSQEANLPIYPNRFSCIDNTTGLEVVCDGMEDVEHEDFLRQQRALNYKPWDTEYLEDDGVQDILLSQFDHLFNTEPLPNFNAVSNKNKGIPDDLIKYIAKFEEMTKINTAFHYDIAYEAPTVSIIIRAHVFTKENYDFHTFVNNQKNAKLSAYYYIDSVDTKPSISIINYADMYNTSIDALALSELIKNPNILYIQPYVVGAAKRPGRKTQS